MACRSMTPAGATRSDGNTGVYDMNRYRLIGLACVGATVVTSLIVAAAQDSGSGKAESRPADSEGYVAPLGGPARHGLSRTSRMGRGDRATTSAPALGESLLSDEQIERLMTFLQRHAPLQY